jgi:hyperosmotically inducible periplasmic protein
VTKRRGGTLRICITMLVIAGCAGHERSAGPLPPTSTSGESFIGQIGDEQATIRLRDALTAKGFTPIVTPYVFIGHAFLVGSVGSPKRAATALELAAGVPGVSSVDGYLATKRPKGASRSDDDAIESTARVVIAANPAARGGHVEVDSVDGHLVLLGVVRTAEARASLEQAARGVGGVTGVTNFLLLPERQ